MRQGPATPVDYTRPAVTPDQLGDAGRGGFDLGPESVDDGRGGSTLVVRLDGFPDVLETEEELLDGQRTVVQAQEGGEMMGGIWMGGVVA